MLVEPIVPFNTLVKSLNPARCAITKMTINNDAHSNRYKAEGILPFGGDFRREKNLLIVWLLSISPKAARVWRRKAALHRPLDCLRSILTHLFSLPETRRNPTSHSAIREKL